MIYLQDLKFLHLILIKKLQLSLVTVCMVYLFPIVLLSTYLCLWIRVFLLKTAHGTVLLFHLVWQSLPLEVLVFAHLMTFLIWLNLCLLFCYLFSICLMSLFFSFTDLFYIKCVFMNYFNLLLHSFLLFKSCFFLVIALRDYNLHLNLAQSASK